MDQDQPSSSLPASPDRATLRSDAMAGVVVGVQSVPDGLATGLLAGVNPLAGLYAYLVGTAAGALTTSSSFMAVQGTGAMAMLVADVDVLHSSSDAGRALVTLSLLTGVLMAVAGLLQLGSVLRFVSNAVMVGFINAVGVNIVLGQLANLTGYAADGPNRVVRALNTFTDPSQIDERTLAVGLVTIALIVVLERTPLRALGLVVAVIATSAAVAALDWSQVATLDDLGVSVDGLPGFEAPLLRLVPTLLVPAAALAFVGLVQGAGISASYPNRDGTYPDASRDFFGQGVANIAGGFLQAMPVGGSVSASALNKEACARSRWSLVFSSVVMAIVIVGFGPAIGNVAMPALAGLLMLVGFRTIKPADLASVWRTGPVQKAVLAVTFSLTLVMPLQYAVLVGVAMSVVLHVIRQSNQVTIRRRVTDPEGQVIEQDPPPTVPPHEVVVLQPYGSLFFAAAPVFEAALPAVDEQTTGSVVIVRLRGRSDLGTTFMDVLHRYADALRQADSRLMLVSANDRILEQLEVTGLTAAIGADHVYPTDERVGHTLARAQRDAAEWVAAHR